MEDKEELADKLRIQAEVGRTRLGRGLGEGMAAVSRSSIAALGGGGAEAQSVADCRGCGFMSSSDHFQNGCPNCGCHDFDLLDSGGEKNNGGK